MVPQVAAELLLVVAMETGLQPILLSSVNDEVGTVFTQMVVSVKALPQVLLPPRINFTVYVPAVLNVILRLLVFDEVQFPGLGLLKVFPNVCPGARVYPEFGLISQTFAPFEQFPFVDTDLNIGLELTIVTGTLTQVTKEDDEMVMAGCGLDETYMGVTEPCVVAQGLVASIFAINELATLLLVVPQEFFE